VAAAAHDAQHFRRYGYFDDALSTLANAVAASRASHDPEAEGAALSDSGRIYLTLGNRIEARKMFHLATYIAEANNLELGVAASLCNMAQVEMLDGDYNHAITLSQQAFAAAQRLGDARMQSVAQLQLGNAYRAKRQYDRAITHYEDALIQRRMIGYRRGEGEALTELAVLHCERGDYARAKAYGMRALDIIESVQDVEIGQQVYVVLADVHRQLGDAQRPHSTHVVLSAWPATSTMRNEKQGHLTASAALLAEGYVDSAVQEFQQAAQIYHDLGQDHHAQRITGLIGDLATPQSPLPKIRTDSPTPSPIPDAG
jgi:tetratricopeptide (TPR) repeat protein